MFVFTFMLVLLIVVMFVFIFRSRLCSSFLVMFMFVCINMNIDCKRPESGYRGKVIFLVKSLIRYRTYCNLGHHPLQSAIMLSPMSFFIDFRLGAHPAPPMEVMYRR